MTTNPKGLSFLSYSRKRASEAALIIQAQHDVGIPTWQDIKNLHHEHSETEIQKVLDDPNTANSVLFLTNEVAGSAMIRSVEAPKILRRAKQQDGFFVVPVAAGALDYAGAAATLDSSINLDDLSQWNISKMTGNPIAESEAKQIAANILSHRISAAHARLEASAPISLELFTRPGPGNNGDSLLKIDWTQRFNGREATTDVWNSYLLPALNTVVHAIQAEAPTRTVEASGLLSIPAATALGFSFLLPRNVKLRWRQNIPGAASQIWELTSGNIPVELTAETTANDVQGHDLAVIVAVSATIIEIDKGIATTRSDFPKFRAITKVFRKDQKRHLIATSQEASALAQLVVEAIRKARQDFNTVRRVHLFMAVPVGLAVMIGQLLNTLGPVQTYEHLQTDAIGRYIPAALLNPS